MITRIISAIIASLIIFPIVILGGNIYLVLVFILSLVGLYEFIKIKESKKKIPFFIKTISYILLTFIVLNNINAQDILLSIDYRIISALILTLLIPTVLYHDSKTYSVNDAFFIIGIIFFLGTAFNLFIIIRNNNLNLLFYLLIITIVTDIFAYFTGFLIGRNKMLECISPKKTWEGFIGGTIAGVFTSVIFFHYVVDISVPIKSIIIISTFLSILGQIGDLFFSAVKRYFGFKDFSNIMPGHGGILDRLDSIIFVLLGFMFFITII